MKHDVQPQIFGRMLFKISYFRFNAIEGDNQKTASQITSKPLNLSLSRCDINYQLDNISFKILFVSC